MKAIDISGIWDEESNPAILRIIGKFSWGEQAYNPIGTLNIDLNAESPYISGASIVYPVKEILRTGKNDLIIIIIDWLDNNKEVKIYIEILNENKIIIKNDVFYKSSRTPESTVYIRVPMDAEVGSTILDNWRK
jgi:hypothetical protein